MRASGNMKVPGGLNVMMCVLDVVFNFLLIFPARQIDVGAVHLTVPGAGLGVLGAALGTVAAELVCAALALWYVTCRQRDLAIFGRRGLGSRFVSSAPQGDAQRSEGFGSNVA